MIRVRKKLAYRGENYVGVHSLVQIMILPCL